MTLTEWIEEAQESGISCWPVLNDSGRRNEAMFYCLSCAGTVTRCYIKEEDCLSRVEWWCNDCEAFVATATWRRHIYHKADQHDTTSGV